MISKKQQLWLDHLNDADKVAIWPWDPTSEEKFVRLRREIQRVFGDEQVVLHRGASGLKISGQDEIDVYVPVARVKFDESLALMTGLFGNPRSNYPGERARFVKVIEGKHVDVFVINRESSGWKDSEMFFQFLLENPADLEEYRTLKESLHGVSTKAYYTRKIEFINAILTRCVRRDRQQC